MSLEERGQMRETRAGHRYDYESFGQQVHVNSFKDTLRFFEYRKIQRMHGGMIKQSQSHPLVAVLVFVLWATVFVLTSVTFKNGVLEFRFFSDEDDGLVGDIYLFIGIGLQVMDIITEHHH
jgi:hypothetical protein